MYLYIVSHYLDGYALISKFEISKSGKVRFEKKYLESDAYKKAVLAQKTVIGEFGTKSMASDPTKGFFSKMVPSIMVSNLVFQVKSNYALFNGTMSKCVRDHGWH